MSNQTSENLRIIFLGFFGFVVGTTVGVALGLGFFWVKNLTSQRSKTETTIVQITPTIQPASLISPEEQLAKTLPVEDPMKAFSAALSSANYKVSTSGKFENKKQEDSGTQTESLDLNNGFIYLQNSSILRVEKPKDETNLQELETVIIKDNKGFILNAEKKSYVVVDPSEELGKWYLNAANASFPPLSLLEDSQKGAISWEKSGNNQWQTEWKWKTPFDPKGIPVKVKIFLHPTTYLIDTVSMKFEDSQPWQDATFRYEKVEDIENLLKIPPEYKEEKLGF